MASETFNRRMLLILSVVVGVFILLGIYLYISNDTINEGNSMEEVIDSSNNADEVLVTINKHKIDSLTKKIVHLEKINDSVKDLQKIFIDSLNNVIDVSKTKITELNKENKNLNKALRAERNTNRNLRNQIRYLENNNSNTGFEEINHQRVADKYGYIVIYSNCYRPKFTGIRIDNEYLGNLYKSTVQEPACNGYTANSRYYSKKVLVGSHIVTSYTEASNLGFNRSITVYENKCTYVNLGCQ